MELTRPLSSSGVASWIVVCLMTTLIWSKAPVSANIRSESGNERDIPKAMVARPKPTTVMSSARPVRRIDGSNIKASAIAKAPTACAELRSPYP